jgi:hypothetical protein
LIVEASRLVLPIILLCIQVDLVPTAAVEGKGGKSKLKGFWEDHPPFNFLLRLHVWLTRVGFKVDEVIKLHNDV